MTTTHSRTASLGALMDAIYRIIMSNAPTQQWLHSHAGNIENRCGNQQIELWQMYRMHCIMLRTRDERSFVFFFLLLLSSLPLLLLLDRNINKHSEVLFFFLSYLLFAQMLSLVLLWRWQAKAADFYASTERGNWIYIQ